MSAANKHTAAACLRQCSFPVLEMILASIDTTDGVSVTALDGNSTQLVEVICQRCGKIYLMQWRSYRRAVRAHRQKGRRFLDQPCIACRRRQKKSGKRRQRLSRDAAARFQAKTGIKLSGADPPLKHRVAAAFYMGRSLTGAEFVHHINGRHNDNRRANIVVLDHDRHTCAHRSFDTVCWRLVCCNLILFDRALGKYIPTQRLLDLVRSQEIFEKEQSCRKKET